MKATIKFYNISGQNQIKEITYTDVERVEYTDYDVKIIFPHGIKKIIYNKADIFTVMEEYDSN